MSELKKLQELLDNTALTFAHREELEEEYTRHLRRAIDNDRQAAMENLEWFNSYCTKKYGTKRNR